MKPFKLKRRACKTSKIFESENFRGFRGFLSGLEIFILELQGWYFVDFENFTTKISF